MNVKLQPQCIRRTSIKKGKKQNKTFSTLPVRKQNSVLWSFKNKNNNLRKKKKSHISWVNLHQDNTMMPTNSVLGDKTKLQHYLILKQTQTIGYPDIIALVAVVLQLAWKLLSPY